PHENVACRDRRKVRDSIAIMMKQENKRLYALEKTTDPDAAHRRRSPHQARQAAGARAQGKREGGKEEAEGKEKENGKRQ
ncbi:MAG: hypothetical protein LUB83_01400, partial [Prevotellaceae bacterium]|nr:hypothetical protein [Prevotellaceae bacterium]